MPRSGNESPAVGKQLHILEYAVRRPRMSQKGRVVGFRCHHIGKAFRLTHGRFQCLLISCSIQFSPQCIPLFLMCCQPSMKAKGPWPSQFAEGGLVGCDQVLQPADGTAVLADLMAGRWGRAPRTPGEAKPGKQHARRSSLALHAFFMLLALLSPLGNLGTARFLWYIVLPILPDSATDFARQCYRFCPIVLPILPRICYMGT